MKRFFPIIESLIGEVPGGQSRILFNPSFQDSIFSNFSHQDFLTCVEWLKRQCFVKNEKCRFYFYPKLAQKFLNENGVREEIITDKIADLDSKIVEAEVNQLPAQSMESHEKSMSSVLTDMVALVSQVYQVLFQAFSQQMKKIVVKKQPSNCKVYFISQDNKTSIVGEMELEVYEILLAMISFDNETKLSQIVFPCFFKLFLNRQFMMEDIKFQVLDNDEEQIVIFVPRYEDWLCFSQEESVLKSLVGLQKSIEDLFKKVQ